VPTLARGQEPTVDDREARAAAAHEAGLAGDPEGFETCAKTYLEIYNDEENHDHPDALLWSAGACSLAAGLAGQAIQVWTVLLDRHPQSEYAKPALLELAGFYAVIAEYEQAATRYEQYAKLYGKDGDTPGAFENAYLCPPN
jgi:tetratricopeptide (TPR) repeat protein